MFEIQIGDITLDVKFTHGTIKKTEKRFTRCRIINRSDVSKMLWGITYCSSQDNYNKNTGRKIALTRAVKIAPRPVRKLIWDAYFRTRGHVD